MQPSLPPTTDGIPVIDMSQTHTIFAGQLSPTGEITGKLPGMEYALPPAGKTKVPRQKREPKPKRLPDELNIEGPSSNDAFQSAMANSALLFSPQALKFLPSNYWLSYENTFNELVTKFFQRKNNANCRFPHKLHNALSMVEQDDSMYNLLGVRWVDDRVFKVDKFIFGRLLGISSIDGGLFHRQGNFTSHGFIEATESDLERLRQGHYDLSDVDMDRIRLLRHRDDVFMKGCDEDSVTKCRWDNDKAPARQPAIQIP